MPTISINKSHLFKALGKDYTDEKFNDILFDFGLELDDIIQDDNGNICYKIEVGANRYDLLCMEGLVHALKCYLNYEPYPEIKIRMNSGTYRDSYRNPKNENIEAPIPDYDFSTKEKDLLLNIIDSDYPVFHLKSSSRPYIACATINNIKFTPESYERFIEYQDKLNLSLGRNRSIVAIGTHDLKKVKFPVIYKEEDPKKVSFVPLNEKEKYNAFEIKEKYLKDTKMKVYSKLLEKNEKYPIFIDANGKVLSLPPLINSEYSKISIETNSIFVEVTGTDFNKVNMTLKYILYNFRGDSISKIDVLHTKDNKLDEKFINMISLIKRHDPNNDLEKGLEFMRLNNENVTSVITPLFYNREYNFTFSEINRELGLNLAPTEISIYLAKMMYYPFIHKNRINVKLSDIRSDVMHKCDIFEDIAIAFGFNNFKRKDINYYTVGLENDLNKFCDKIRKETSECGYNEVLTLSLLSLKDSTNGSDDKKNVLLANPKSQECEVVRNSLLPGILKSIHSNKHSCIPIKIFEVSDVVLVDDENYDNEKRYCSVFAGKTDGLEHTIGLLSKILDKMGFEGNYKYNEVVDENSVYFPMRNGEVLVRKNNESSYVKIGSVGVIHPKVLNSFKIPFAASSFEISVDKLFGIYK